MGYLKISAAVQVVYGTDFFRTTVSAQMPRRRQRRTREIWYDQAMALSPSHNGRDDLDGDKVGGETVHALRSGNVVLFPPV